MPKIKSMTLSDTPPLSGLEIKDIPESTRLVVLIGPNGSGKTTLLHSLSIASQFSFHKGSQPRVRATLHGSQISRPFDVYLRTAYRTEHSLHMPAQQAITQMHSGVVAKRPPLQSSGQDNRLTINIGLLLKQVQDAALNTSHTWDSAMKEFLDPISKRISALFPGLEIVSIPRPLAQPIHANQDYLCFTKDGVSHPYNALSSGEKEVFDLLLDLHLSAALYKDSIFCIDEPELHIHTELQGCLIKELLDFLPNDSQLWIATHSIGIINKSMQLLRDHPEEVSFIDLGSVKPPQTISPNIANRLLWKSALRVSLADLSDLVSPKQIVICEGEPRISASPRKGKNTEFDATVYNAVFSASHPDTEFVSGGACGSVIADTMKLKLALESLVPAAQITRLIDRDNKADHEIAELRRKGIKALSCYSIENFLWSDEILQKLCRTHACAPDEESAILEAKAVALGRAVGSAEQPSEAIKDIDHVIYDACKKINQLKGRGSTANAFARTCLAPLVTPETLTYQILERDIFG